MDVSAYVSTYVYICMYTCVCTYVCMCIRMYVYVYIAHLVFLTLVPSSALRCRHNAYMLPATHFFTTQYFTACLLRGYAPPCLFPLASLNLPTCCSAQAC